MTLAPMYKAIRRETSKKPPIREKPAEFLGTGYQCKEGLLPSIKPNIYENVEIIKSAKQDDIYGASNIVLPCPCS